MLSSMCGDEIDWIIACAQLSKVFSWQITKNFIPKGNTLQICCFQLPSGGSKPTPKNSVTVVTKILVTILAILGSWRYLYQYGWLAMVLTKTMWLNETRAITCIIDNNHCYFKIQFAAQLLLVFTRKSVYKNILNESCLTWYVLITAEQFLKSSNIRNSAWEHILSIHQT